MITQQEAANKKTAIALSEAIMAGEWDRVDELIDDSFLYVGDARPPLDKKGYIGFMRGVLCEAMGDMDMTFPRVVAEGELVAVEYTNTMTHKGTFMGIPATGKQVVTTGHFIREIKDGKVTAEWQTTNAMGLMAQLGVVPGK